MKSVFLKKKKNSIKGVFLWILLNDLEHLCWSELPGDCLWDLILQSQLETPTERCNASNFVGICGFLQNIWNYVFK